MSVSYAERPLEPASNELPFSIAVLLSFLITSVVTTVAVVLLQQAAIRPSPKPTTIHVAMVQLPAPPAPPLVAPPPEALEPPPLPLVVLPTAPVAPLMVPPRPPQPLRRLAHIRSQPRLTRPQPVGPSTPTAAPVQAPVPISAPRQPASDNAARESLEARIKQAIQASFRYPEAAREMGTQGTAVVGFVYRDRSAVSVHIVQSSRSPILDQAAVLIVVAAAMPPPGRMAGQTLILTVPVRFDLGSDED